MTDLSNRQFLLAKRPSGDARRDDFTYQEAAVSALADGQILGTYLHGLFDEAPACAALLRWAGLHSDAAVDSAALRDASLDRIADAAEPLLMRLFQTGSADT
ncbi:MAG: hypothetical protein EOO81_11885 [Oxalobacteraceae bacterium]|nr:MAG: hypothetical protein EOO81_11885 [Oxalobacteraceae bacterium]